MYGKKIFLPVYSNLNNLSDPCCIFKYLFYGKCRSLWDIANEHMTEEYDSPKTYIKEVKSINSLTDVDKIYAGQRIVIPYYSTELK